MGKIWRNKYFQYSFSFILAFCFISLPDWEAEKTDVPSPLLFAGDTLNCSIMLDKTLRAKGYSIGYLYELFQKFENHQRCKINLTIVEQNAMQQWVQLITGKTDMLILNSQKDTVPSIFEDEVVSSSILDRDEDVCVVRKDKYNIVQTLNYWFPYFRQTQDYSQTQRYHKSYRIADRNGAPISRTTISPYDVYVKKYAPILGWDWRLICSLIYQESKFKMGVSSSRGAIGLMQIKESVGKTYGINDIYDPEQNIKAGICHLARLQKLYKKAGADSTNVIKLTLAAYNCGEGRLQDCMALAQQKGLDPLVWENLAEVIPLMKEEEHYKNDAVKLGRFNGGETLKFVELILERYGQYCQSVVK